MFTSFPNNLHFGNLFIQPTQNLHVLTKSDVHDLKRWFDDVEI